MTDKPIIFSAAMVNALLSGRKTMTRRLASSPLRRIMPGDRLWVREGHAYSSWDEEGQFIIDYLADDARSDWLSPADGDASQDLMERLCGQFDRAGIKLGPDGNYQKPHKRFGKPSIHMPRWASRLTLVVTGRKVERLNDLTEEDALWEGVVPMVDQFDGCFTVPGTAAMSGTNARDCFKRLWNSLHGPDAWDANPEVIAVSFRVVKANIDSEEFRAAA